MNCKTSKTKYKQTSYGKYPATKNRISMVERDDTLSNQHLGLFNLSFRNHLRKTQIGVKVQPDGAISHILLLFLIRPSSLVCFLIVK